MINHLYDIQNKLFSLDENELVYLNGLYDSHHDFSDKILQKEIGIEKLKRIFFQYLRKEKKFDKFIASPFGPVA